MKKKITWMILCVLIVFCGWNVTINEWNQAGRTDSEYTEKSINARAQSSDGQTVTLEDTAEQAESYGSYHDINIEAETENITDYPADLAEQQETGSKAEDTDHIITEDQNKSVSDVRDDTLADNKASGNQVKESTMEETEAKTETEAETETETERVKYKTGYIFLGDSRFYLLNEQCNIEDVPNFFVVACPGMGYAWLVDTALPEVQNIQKHHKEIENWVVICGLGVNDLTSIRSYLNKYERWPINSKLYLLSVNPTKKGAPARCSNQRIESFNKRLKKVKNAVYLDSYHYLAKLGFGTKSDGVHYDESTNWAIYSYILEQVNRKEGGEPVSESECKIKAEKLQKQLSQKNY